MGIPYLEEGHKMTIIECVKILEDDIKSKPNTCAKENCQDCIVCLALEFAVNCLKSIIRKKLT